MLILSIICAIFVATTLATQPEQAQQPPPPTLENVQEAFAELDADGNNIATREEAEAYLATMGVPRKELKNIVDLIWSHEDLNNDGVVSLEEFTQVHYYNNPLIQQGDDDEDDSVE